MNDKLISSAHDTGRSRVGAFAGSLIFTGLGQLYAGAASKGIVFLLLRIAAAGIFPVLLFYNREFPLFYTMVGCVLFDIFIIISCAIHAGVTAGKSGSIGFKQYMRPYVYIVYALGVLLVMTLIYGMLFSMVSLTTMPSPRMEPVIMKDDRILIIRFPGLVPSVGDSVLITRGEEKLIRRVVAAGPENVIIKGTAIRVNNTPLERTIMSDHIAARLKIANREEYYLERNDDILYPVMIPPKGRQKGGGTSMIYLAKEKYLAASDNRTGDDWFLKVESDQVSGRVAGVLYSPGRGIWFLPVQ
ncbi:MAG: S26 family signal peptidase [Spirochaetota bacterium]